MRLSVVLPTTGRPGLRAAIQSVMSQLLPGDELLLVGATAAIADLAHTSGDA